MFTKPIMPTNQPCLALAQTSLQQSWTVTLQTLLVSVAIQEQETGILADNIQQYYHYIINIQ